jgi:hypothetical protein
MQSHHNKHMSHRNQKGASECVYVVCVCVCLGPSAKLQTIDFRKVKSLAHMYVCMYVWNNWL